MKRLVTLITFLFLSTACLGKARAQGDDARSHCVQKFSAGFGINAHMTLRNSCPGKIYAFWVVLNPVKGEPKTGNRSIGGGDTIDTTIAPGRSVHVYACAYPKFPRDSQGNALSDGDSQYTCR